VSIDSYPWNKDLLSRGHHTRPVDQFFSCCQNSEATTSRLRVNNLLIVGSTPLNKDANNMREHPVSTRLSSHQHPLFQFWLCTHRMLDTDSLTWSWCLPLLERVPALQDPLAVLSREVSHCQSIFLPCLRDWPNKICCHVFIIH